MMLSHALSLVGDSMLISEFQLQQLKAQFMNGTRVRLVSVTLAHPVPLGVGEIGEVDYVDCKGGIHINWLAEKKASSVCDSGMIRSIEQDKHMTFDILQREVDNVVLRGSSYRDSRDAIQFVHKLNIALFQSQSMANFKLHYLTRMKGVWSESSTRQLITDLQAQKVTDVSHSLGAIYSFMLSQN
ncbi:DUF4314 domain-containing protein [Vibrio sp. 1180_3]|uniref:DUF4314 domain-containing protein n=1 Tax=Vibrio sp. 1180_3 TaxID=2528832 RepID=UPI002406468C|nr:DUF4314 domain-containing protein [Vibrio sp. 1180_3]MDF9399076.1 DUF4314 domain-containing protein [Vibrio sp. 1180_3]